MKSKREMILLGGVALSVVVLLYNRMVPEMKANQDNAIHRVEMAKKFVDEQNKLIKQSELRPYERQMLDMLFAEEPANPFARRWVGMVSDQKRINKLSTIEPVLSYNGYLRVGDRYVALVNDGDYEVGNKIDHVPLYIRMISSDRIDVENPNTAAESRLSVKLIPLEEDDGE